MPYYRAAARFFAWCDRYSIGEIADIEPLHVAAYVEGLGKDFEKPTVKQHLAAIRMLFDWLVTGQVVATNPAHSVRGPKHEGPIRENFENALIATSRLDLPELFLPIRTLKSSMPLIVVSFTLRKFWI
jgi:site-specific recombinase XerD